MSRNMFALSLPLAAAALFMTATMSPTYAKSPDAPKQESGSQARKGFGGWGISCEGVGDKKKCFAIQTQMNPEGTERVLEVVVGHIGPNNVAVMVVMLPLGVNVQAGAVFKIDDASQTPMKIHQCIAVGCQATLQLDDAMLKALRSGKKVLFSMVPFSTNKAVSVMVPLDGLDKTLSSLK